MKELFDLSISQTSSSLRFVVHTDEKVLKLVAVLIAVYVGLAIAKLGVEIWQTTKRNR